MVWVVCLFGCDSSDVFDVLLIIYLVLVVEMGLVVQIVLHLVLVV